MKILLSILLCIISGCATKEGIQESGMTVEQVVSNFLEAYKNRDTLEMSSYTKSGLGDDFSWSQEDAQNLGLSYPTLETLSNYVFDFQYTIQKVEDLNHTAKVEVYIQTYALEEVMQHAIELYQEEFSNIFHDDSLDEQAKNKKISDIIVNEFKNANKNYQVAYTFECETIDGEWKINDDNLESFYKIVWNLST